jgi:3-isopropylmalate/(R)-2-methylmalate dehydratase small subunit
MKKIKQVSGLVIPLNMRDVDTDLIIPAQYLTQVSKQGYGQAVFRRLRDTDPNFVFNQAQFSGAKILVAGENFGCGSSREHAVWALMEAGIEAIIANSFSDIFSSNSSKNGLVLIIQPDAVIKKMLSTALKGNYQLTIDLEKQVIQSSQNEEFNFSLNPFQRYCFINGHDQLDYIVQQKNEIENFDNNQKEKIYSTVFNSHLEYSSRSKHEKNHRSISR